MINYKWIITNRKLKLVNFSFLDKIIDMRAIEHKGENTQFI